MRLETRYLQWQCIVLPPAMHKNVHLLPLELPALRMDNGGMDATGALPLDISAGEETEISQVDVGTTS